MARRGRFTNPNAGGQNLSSLIISLLRERKNAEEQLLLEKFRNKEVTAEEVQAFYDNWSRTSGYTEGTLEFDQLNQRKKNAYDTGVKYQYDDLLADFNSTGGENYTQFMDFLNGTAQSVNDKNSAQQYLDARKNVTSNFINQASDQLKQGRITIEEFRRQVDSGIESSFDKGTKEYNDTKYAAFVAEYNGEYNKYKNRIDAGKSGAYSGFISFLNAMKTRMSADGVGGELLTRIDADMASVRASGRTAESNTQISRFSKSQDALAAIYSAALAVSGIPGAELTKQNIDAGQNYGIDDITANPGAIAAFIRLLRDGSIEMPESLIKMGINSVEDLETRVNTEVKAIGVAAASANRINPTKANSDLENSAKAIGRSLGTTTQVDEVDDALNRFTNDVQVYGASGDDIALTRANNEMEKFLAGKPSIYGQISRTALDKELSDPNSGIFGANMKIALANTEKGLKGELISTTDSTLEGFYGKSAGYNGDKEIPFSRVYADGSVQETDNNTAMLLAGIKVQVVTRDPQTGEVVSRVTTDPIASGPTGYLGNTKIASKSGGYLSVIAYVPGPDGNEVPVIQSIAARRVIRTGGNGVTSDVWGYEYQYDDGSQVYISTGGVAYDSPPFQETMTVDPDNANGYFVNNSTIADGVTARESLPVVRVDTTGKSFAELQSIATKLKELAADPNFIKSLGAVDKANLDKQVAEVEDKAIQLESTNTQILLSRAQRDGAPRSEILRLQSQLFDLKNNSTEGGSYRSFVASNPGKYKEVEPGVFELIGPSAAQKFALDKYGVQTNVDANGNKLPERVDIRLDKTVVPTGGSPRDILDRAPGGFAEGIIDFFRNKPTAPTNLSTTSGTGVSINPMNDKYGGITPPALSVATSITPASMKPFNPADPEERRALIAQQSQTTPPKPVAPPTRIGGK